VMSPPSISLPSSSPYSLFGSTPLHSALTPLTLPANQIDPSRLSFVSPPQSTLLPSPTPPTTSTVSDHPPHHSVALLIPSDPNVPLSSFAPAPSTPLHTQASCSATRQGDASLGDVDQTFVLTSAPAHPTPPNAAASDPPTSIHHDIPTSSRAPHLPQRGRRRTPQESTGETDPDTLEDCSTTSSSSSSPTPRPSHSHVPHPSSPPNAHRARRRRVRRHAQATSGTESQESASECSDRTSTSRSASVATVSSGIFLPPHFQLDSTHEEHDKCE
jgi:hypothetical protein